MNCSRCNELARLPTVIFFSLYNAEMGKLLVTTCSQAARKSQHSYTEIYMLKGTHCFLEQDWEILGPSQFIYWLWGWIDKSKNPEKWVAGQVSLWSRGQSAPPPPTSWMLEDLQTLHIPTNKKLEVWTQYRLLLSFLGGYTSLLLITLLRQREICKNPEIRKNHEKSQVCLIIDYLSRVVWPVIIKQGPCQSPQDVTKVGEKNQIIIFRENPHNQERIENRIHISSIVFEYLNIWIFEYLNIWIFEYLNIWIFEYLNIWIFDYSNIWILKHLNIQIFKYSNIQIFEYLNICTTLNHVLTLIAIAEKRAAWQWFSPEP